MVSVKVGWATIRNLKMHDYGDSEGAHGRGMDQRGGSHAGRSGEKKEERPIGMTKMATSGANTMPSCGHVWRDGAKSTRNKFYIEI